MLNADRVSAVDFLKLMVSGGQINKKQTIVKQNKLSPKISVWLPDYLRTVEVNTEDA